MGRDSLAARKHTVLVHALPSMSNMEQSLQKVKCQKASVMSALTRRKVKGKKVNRCVEQARVNTSAHVVSDVPGGIKGLHTVQE
jgi:hypothetical protein